MKFSMSEAWGDATAMMSANREVLLIVAGIFFLLPSVVLTLAMPGMEETMMADPENASARVLELYAGWWWLLLIVLLAQVVGYLGLLALLRDASRPTVGEALRVGMAGLLPAIGVYLIMGAGLAAAAILIGVLMATAPALGVVAIIAGLAAMIYLAIKLCLAVPVIAIDKIANPLSAIGRSWQLTRGNSFRLFLFFLLLIIVYVVISLVMGMIVGAIVLTAGTSTALLVNGVISAVISTALTVVMVAVIAAIHRQLAGTSAAAISETFE